MTGRRDPVSLMQRAGPRYEAPTPFCLDDSEIAAYGDSFLDDEDRQRVERHVADCDICADRVGLLVRLSRDREETTRPTEAAFARAVRLRKSTAPPWAAAAAIVLAILIVSDFPTDNEIVMDDEPVTTRMVDRSASSLQIFSPEQGGIVNADDLVFRWQTVENSLHYELTIVTDAGDLVMQQRVMQTEWEAPEDLDLQAGTKYFVRVDAVMPDAKAISSRHVSFLAEARD